LSNLNEERDVVDKSNWYFTDETEEAIVQYNKRLSKCCNAEIRFEKTVIDGEKNIEKYICSLCGKELEENESYYELSERQRDDLFRSKIYKPFEKLAQSLIYTYEFFYFDVPPADVIKEVVSVLCTKMYRYHQDEGRAFSFFSVIAKRYLINNNNRNYKYYISHSSIDSYTEKQKDFKMANVFDKMDKNTDPEIIKDNQKIINRLVDYLENNIETIFNKRRDKNIAYSVVELIKNHENAIENYHKKALYILIREYSGEKTQYITQVLKKIKKHYDKIVENFYTEKILFDSLI
jgi:hypothetical protein